MARAKLTAFVSLNSTAFRRGLRMMRRRWRAFRTNVMGPMVRFGRMVGRTFVRAGLALGAALVGAIKHANDFRRQMAEVNTMLDGQDLEQYTEGILRMSGRFGMAKDALTKGLYDILSAGIAAEHGLEVLEVATRGAIGGATDTAVSVDALTTVLNAFGLAATKAAHVSDVLFQIVKDGKITYAELAENIGKLAPTARAAGMSLEQMGAAIATVVKVEKPERAMTAIRAAMFKAAEEGENLFQLVRKFRGKSLEDIIQAGIAKRAAQGVAILANNFDLLLKEMARFENVAGRAEAAFEKMDKVRFWARLWQTVLSIVARIGTVLDKTLAPAIDFLTRKLNELVDTPGFQRFLEQVETATKTITGALIALARGGAGRRMALTGFKLVIIGAFQAAAQKAGDILMKVAPFIGRLIGEGAQQAFEGPIKKLARFQVAQEIAVGMAGRAEIPVSEIAAERRRQIEKIKGEELQQAIDRLSKEFNVALGPSANNLKLGLDLLQKAAEEATKDLEEFDIALEEPEEAAKRKPPPAAIPGDDERRERGFSELRRIGANILTGAGPQGRENVAQKTRVQLLKEAQETNKWLREGDKRMKEILQREAMEEDPSAVF